MKIRIATYFRNRREMRLRKWCIEMVAKLAEPTRDSTGLAEEIYRWVKGIPESKT